MLAEGKLTSLAAWTAYGETVAVQAAELTIASAELLFRQGRFYESEVMALLAVEELTPDDEWVSRAYAAAGRAAHAANREREALEHYRAASRVARSERQTLEAALGELSAAIDLELPEAPLLLQRLHPDPEDVEGLVVYVSRRLGLDSRFGTHGGFEEPRRVYRLLHRVRDPVLRCSFRNIYGFAVASAGDIDEARLVVSDQLEDASRYRLDFVVPHAQLISALIALVLGDFPRVFEAIDDVERAGKANGDDLLTANVVSIRTRCLIAQGSFGEAVRESLRWTGAVTPSMLGELLASRSLALACSDEYQQAIKTAGAAIQATEATEAKVASAATRAVVAISRGDVDAFDRAHAAFQSALTLECLECFITAYRGCPALAELLLRSKVTREDMRRVIAVAGDTEAFAAVTRNSEKHDGAWNCLSPREQEVLVLVANGHPNRDIAKTLYIAEATVKVHVSHILEKLGVRSRTAAALRVPFHKRSTRRVSQAVAEIENP